MENDPTILYREVQRFRQPLIWIFLISIALFSIYGMVQQLILGKPFGNNPAPDVVLIIIVIIVGLGFPVFFYVMNLTIEVRTDGLYIRFFPLHVSFRKVEFTNIARYEVRTYRPIRDYGGWGIRWGRKGKAYNVSGNRGLQFELSDGKRLLLGSQKPEELAKALDFALGGK